MYWKPVNAVSLNQPVASWVIKETLESEFGPLPLVLSSEHVERLQELAAEHDDEYGKYNPYTELVQAINLCLSIRVTEKP